ncbi:MAG: hypothetical protein RBS77_04705 [Candidatus Moranbacteria bacterium]|jgi:hypothetical protein|nr:hypothetical protein [Candidatus Moranbacteria bacterium]
MINKKVSTVAGSLIILAIVIAIGFVFLSSNKKEKEMQDQNNVVLNNSDLGNKEEVKQEEVVENKKKENEIPSDVNKITSDKNKWKNFRSKENNIELKYPPELYLSTSRKDIILSLSRLSPEESKKNPDAGIMSQIIIYAKNKNVDNMVEEIKSNHPSDFTQKIVIVDGLRAIQITYRGVYAGELWVETLIKKDSNNTIVVDYPGDSQSNVSIFEMIIATLKII